MRLRMLDSSRIICLSSMEKPRFCARYSLMYTGSSEPMMFTTSSLGILGA